MARTTVDVAVSITPAAKAWIDAVRTETGMSRGEIVRWMVAFFVERNIKPIVIRSVSQTTVQPPPSHGQAAD